MSGEKELDQATGVETTGHVWDNDLKELNRPMPKWWLYTFYVTIIWAIGYMIAMPAWPLANSYTKGLLGYSQRAVVMEEVKAGQAAQSEFRAKIEKTELADIAKDEELLRFSNAGGAAAFGTNCSPCHGRGAQGFTGYPNLNDDDWIWGGTVENIHQTILYGIRSTHDETRASDMPRFGDDGLLEQKQITDAAQYVLSLSGASSDAEAVTRGKVVYDENCAACHGEDGKGNQELGAPNLTNGIWLYGGTKEDVVTSIRTGRGGQMPPWAGRLDPVTIKMLSVYVHSLGGGQ